MKKRLFSIGEALIDFIPQTKALPLKEVEAFIKKAGGAPANVCAAAAKQGVPAAFIGKVGQDAFGDFLVETMDSVGIDTSHVFRTERANTTLAFVSLTKEGERDFSFYRNPGADMLLNEKEIDEEWFTQGDYLHFGTVDLIDAPVKQAHIKAIECAKKKSCTVIFDPNLRLALWPDEMALKKTVWDFMGEADILKVSDNELFFIFDTDDVKLAAQMAFEKGVRIFLYTMGKDGSRLVTQNMDIMVPPFVVEVADTTGAGDAFIGAFAAQLMLDDIDIKGINEDKARALLAYANACGAMVASRYGAIESMPTRTETIEFIEEYEKRAAKIKKS